MLKIENMFLDLALEYTLKNLYFYILKRFSVFVLYYATAVLKKNFVFSLPNKEDENFSSIFYLSTVSLWQRSLVRSFERYFDYAVFTIFKL